MVLVTVSVHRLVLITEMLRANYSLFGDSLQEFKLILPSKCN